MARVNAEFSSFTLERAIGGESIEVLSTRNGKLVEHVRDDEGDFVRRTYLPEGVSEVRSVGVTFAEGWRAFNQMFTNAGIEVVQSALIDETVDDKPIIVAKYLGKLGREASAKSLPKDAKVELAGNIGRLLTSHELFLPNPQAFMPDAFIIDPDTDHIVLVDVDPYLKQRERSFSASFLSGKLTEASQGAFMLRSGWNIAEWAVDDDERTAMASAFCRTAGEALTDDSSMELINHFGYVHFMANGMTPKQLEKMGY